MRTAQNTDAAAPRKEPQGSRAVSAALGLTLSLALAACSGLRGGAAGPPPGARGPVVDAPASRLLRSADASERRAAVRRLRDGGRTADVRLLLTALSDRDVDVAADAALALAICGAPGAPGRLVAALGPDARPEVVAAAALGLGSLSGADAEQGLLALARRPERPPAVPGALFSHYRWRGRPVEPHVAEPALLDYAHYATAEGRAGFAQYARAVKDPALVPLLIELAHDADPAVRQVAVGALAPSSKTPWPPAEEERALAELQAARADADAQVVVAACRALSGFGHRVTGSLQESLAHPSFHVRVAALEGLVRVLGAEAAEEIARLAEGDPSVSVRAAAASALAKLNPTLSETIAEVVLRDPSEFVRASGCELLAATENDGVDAATERLAALAFDDPHVRVRESALGALEGREGAVVEQAVRRALAEDRDPVVVAVACGVAASNGLDGLLPLVRAVPDRFPGRDGGDAREGALDALGKLGLPEDAALLRAHLRDDNPSVVAAAERGLAALGGYDPPAPARTGVHGAGPGDLDFSVSDGPVSLEIETSRGSMTIDLDPAAAPLHVAHVVAFAERGGYDGLTWHRVVPDFVIQGGCPRGDGAGNAGVSLPLEPTRIPFERGVLGMPRSSHPDSGGCQLFVMHARAPHLDVHYTAFGRVVRGLDVIDAIDVDDLIVSVRVVRRAR